MRGGLLLLGEVLWYRAVYCLKVSDSLHEFLNINHSFQIILFKPFLCIQYFIK